MCDVLKIAGRTIERTGIAMIDQWNNRHERIAVRLIVGVQEEYDVEEADCKQTQT